MKKQKDDIRKLFNPNMVYTGEIDKTLENYPGRSKNLERYSNEGINAKDLNFNFIKDGYMYLLRGACNGQETGFYSRAYSNKETIESLGLDPNRVAFAQSLNGNTPFISTTTDIYVASAFSKKQRIYVIKIPIEDVYTFYKDDNLMESEYMIPDYISSEEIIRSFRFDKFKQIYNYLTTEIGLSITPEDLGTNIEDILAANMSKIDRIMYFNESSSFLDPLLGECQNAFLGMDLDGEDTLNSDNPLILKKSIDKK